MKDAKLIQKTAKEVHSLLQGLTYTHALKEFSELNQILIRLGFSNMENGYYQFLSMDEATLTSQYGNQRIINLTFNSSKEFIIELLVNGITGLEPPLTIYTLEDIFMIDRKHLQFRLAKYILDTTEQPEEPKQIGRFLKLSEVVKLLNNFLLSPPSNKTLASYLDEKIQLRNDIIPIDKENLIKHAFLYKSFIQFCSSFHGIAANNMKFKLKKFSIYSQEEGIYIPLTFDLLQQKIKEFDRIYDLETKFNEISKYIGPKEYTLLSVEEGISKFLQEKVKPIELSLEEIEAFDLKIDNDSNHKRKFTEDSFSTTELDAIDTFTHDEDFYSEFIRNHNHGFFNSSKKQKKDISTPNLAEESQEIDIDLLLQIENTNF